MTRLPSVTRVTGVTRVTRTSRRGSTLALVALVVAIVSLLAAALTTSAWRAQRASTMSRSAQDMVRAIDVAGTAAVSGWTADSVAQRAMGVTVHRADQTLLGTSVRAAWRRTHPLFAWLELDAVQQTAAPVPAARRHERRAYWLQPPPVPTAAALTSAGMLEGEDGTFISGTDVGVATSWCPGGYMPLASTPIVAGDVAPTPSRIWSMMPAWRAISTLEQSALSAAWSAVLARVTGQAAAGSAQSPSSDPEWRALRLDGDTVVLRGPMRWHGLLAANGVLRIEGDVEVRGLLMARRALDATAAALVIHGALIAGSASTDRTRLGPSARVHFDRCAIDLALATIARPRAAPLGLRMPLGLW